jgi:hypothetical protein
LSVQISTDLGARRRDWILCYDMLTDFVHLALVDDSVSQLSSAILSYDDDCDGCDVTQQWCRPVCSANY